LKVGNYDYFSSNYTAISVCTCFFFAAFHWFFGVSLVVSAAVAYLLLGLQAVHSRPFFHRALVFFVVLVICQLVFKTFSTCAIAAALSIAVCTLHAMLRPSVAGKAKLGGPDLDELASGSFASMLAGDLAQLDKKRQHLQSSPEYDGVEDEDVHRRSSSSLCDAEEGYSRGGFDSGSGYSTGTDAQSFSPSGIQQRRALASGFSPPMQQQLSGGTVYTAPSFPNSALNSTVSASTLYQQPQSQFYNVYSSGDGSQSAKRLN
jgi:hypothetical protein